MLLHLEKMLFECHFQIEIGGARGCNGFDGSLMNFFEDVLKVEFEIF